MIGYLYALIFGRVPAFPSFRRGQRAGRPALIVTADRNDDVVTFTPPASMTAAAVDPATRTISGVIVPYGVIGLTNVGPLIVNAGALEWPEDLSRVKLFSDHFGPVVGYLTQLDDTAEAASGVFAIANTPAGDLVLAEAADKVRDGFSIELIGMQLDPADDTTVTAAGCRGVAAVPIPAFDDARVTEVAAARLGTTQPEGTNPMKCTICGHEHAATVTCSDHAASLMVTAGAPAPDAAASHTDPPAGPPAGTPAGIPAGLPMPGHVAGGRPSDAIASLDDMARFMHAAATGRATPDMLAALSDITQTAVGADVEQASWVGQLWSGVGYTRKIVPLFGSPKPLTSFKVNGWKWTTKPAMAAYAGDKNDVPSNQPATDPVSIGASRLAGAHDHDRKFVDFDSPDYWTAYYEAMADSYARLSDAAALAAALAGATAVDNAFTSGGFLDAIATGVSAIDDADNVSDTFVVASKTDLIPFILGTTNDELPAFLALLGVNPERIVTHSGITAGTVLVGTSPAMSYYELSPTPIRVEAVDLTKGGVDTGCFGYHAELVNDADGLQLVDITPAP